MTDQTTTAGPLTDEEYRLSRENHYRPRFNKEFLVGIAASRDVTIRKQDDLLAGALAALQGARAVIGPMKPDLGLVATAQQLDAIIARIEASREGHRAEPGVAR